MAISIFWTKYDTANRMIHQRCSLRSWHTISVSPPLPPVGPSILVTSSVPRLDAGYGQGYQQPQTGHHQPPPHPCTEQVHRLNRRVDFLREMSFTSISSHTLYSVLSTRHPTLPVWKEQPKTQELPQKTISALEQRNGRKTKGFYLLQLFRQKELSELLPGLI